MLSLLVISPFLLSRPFSFPNNNYNVYYINMEFFFTGFCIHFFKEKERKKGEEKKNNKTPTLFFTQKKKRDIYIC